MPQRTHSVSLSSQNTLVRPARTTWPHPRCAPEELPPARGRWQVAVFLDEDGIFGRFVRPPCCRAMSASRQPG